ncbi:MAG: hypothetical protein HY755_02315 [Nitrospirae bacterium]|nr:hypothetical protein [Nitrospirota bacterium]
MRFADRFAVLAINNAVEFGTMLTSWRLIDMLAEPYEVVTVRLDWPIYAVLATDNTILTFVFKAAMNLTVTFGLSVVTLLVVRRFWPVIITLKVEPIRKISGSMPERTGGEALGALFSLLMDKRFPTSSY